MIYENENRAILLLALLSFNFKRHLNLIPNKS